MSDDPVDDPRFELEAVAENEAMETIDFIASKSESAEEAKQNAAKYLEAMRAVFDDVDWDDAIRGQRAFRERSLRNMHGWDKDGDDEEE